MARSYEVAHGAAAKRSPRAYDNLLVFNTDPIPLELIAHAMLAQRSALTGEHDPIVSNYSKRHFWQLLRVSSLAPDIIAAIAEGRQPATLTGGACC